MLRVSNISVYYDEICAINGATVAVDAGEIVTLIGSNGAGKSTFQRTLSGLQRVRDGQILFEGEPVHGLPPDEIVRRGIVHVPEGRKIFIDLTVEENLMVGGHLVKERAKLRSKLEEVFALFPRLKERRTQRGETLSGGEQQMLALGRAMMSHPRLLLLDEPSLGLAPLIVREVAQAIKYFQQNGITVFLVEQNAKMSLTLSDRGYVIENGSIILTDTGANLLSSPLVREAYLGIKTDALPDSAQAAEYDRVPD